MVIYYKTISKLQPHKGYHEDKWICKLKPLAPHCLNTEIGDYVKQINNFYWFRNELL